MRNKILHIVPVSHEVKNIQAMAPEIGMVTSSDVAFLDSNFSEGYVPKSFEKEEIDWFLSNSERYSFETNSAFFDFLKNVKPESYDEVFFWYENHANSLMLLSIICNIFQKTNISLVITERLCDLSYFFGYQEAYEQRVELLGTKGYIAKMWDKEEWIKPSYWGVENDEIIPIPEQEIRNTIIKYCKSDKFIACARVVGECMGHTKFSIRFSLNVYFSLIMKMIEEGILEAQQLVSLDEMKKIFDEEPEFEHIFSPDGVDISVMRIFSVKIAGHKDGKP